MDYVEFATPEDVELGFELAGPSSRFGGYALDRFLLLMVQLIFLLIFVAIGSAGHFVELGGGALIAFYIALLGFSEFLYFGLCEWLGNGISPGKKRVGMQVVMAGGHQLTPSAVFVRNIFRPIDMIPLFWIVPLLDGQCRRLGDLVAGTIVVRRASHATKDLMKLPLASRKYADLAERHIQLSSLDQGILGAKDFHAIEEFLTRARSFPSAQRKRLASIMLTPILQKLKRPSVEEFAKGGIASQKLLEEIYMALRENPRLMD